MSVKVILGDHSERTFDATSFVFDNDGFLQVVKDNIVVAVFAAQHWAGVYLDAAAS